MKYKNGFRLCFILIVSIFLLCGCGGEHYINKTSQYLLDMLPFSAKGLLNASNKIMCYENNLYSLNSSNEGNSILMAEFDENGIKENTESILLSKENSQFTILDFDIDVEGIVYILCQKEGKVFIVIKKKDSAQLKETWIENISEKISHTIPQIKVDKNGNICLYYNQMLHIYDDKLNEIANMIMIDGDIFRDHRELYVIVTDEKDQKFKIKEIDIENSSFKDVITIKNKSVSTDMFCYNEALGLTYFDEYNLYSIDLESNNVYKFFNLSKLQENKYMIHKYCFLEDDTMLLLLTKDGASGFYTIKFTNRE